MTDNYIMIHNNMLSFNLRQKMNDVNDLVYNIQNLKQLQTNIVQIQKMKDSAQMQLNMAALALIRSNILDFSIVGPILFRNLIRRFYPLNDNQILKYENDKVEEGKYRITNAKVLARKGGVFSICDNDYYILPQNRYRAIYEPSIDLISEITINDFRGYIQQDTSLYNSVRNKIYSPKWNFYKRHYNIDPLKHEDLSIESGIHWSELQANVYMQWNWNIVEYIASQKGSCSVLLNNPGFMAQMGIGQYEETIRRIQLIIKKYGLNEDISEESVNSYVKMYNDMGVKLSSYLSIDKVFIILHQNELDWRIILQNPRIIWDWELINLFLEKYSETISEFDWEKYLKHPSRAIYSLIEPLLNDSIINDIEKLYDL